MRAVSVAPKKATPDAAALRTTAWEVLARVQSDAGIARADHLAGPPANGLAKYLARRLADDWTAEAARRHLAGELPADRAERYGVLKWRIVHQSPVTDQPEEATDGK